MPEATPPADGGMTVPEGQPRAQPDAQAPAAGGGTEASPPSDAAPAETQPDANAPAQGEQPESQQGETKTEGEQPSDKASPDGGNQDQPGTSGAAEGQQAPSSDTKVEVTQEQRVEIRNVVKEVDVTRVDVDFDVKIGVAVPRTVVLHPLPSRIVEIVPAYRGYVFFILSDGTIIIVNPNDLVIVAVINV
jgi:hypothetical protein